MSKLEERLNFVQFSLNNKLFDDDKELMKLVNEKHELINKLKLELLSKRR